MPQTIRDVQTEESLGNRRELTTGRRRCGGELRVRSAAQLGLRLGMSPLVVGLTVVAFGTSGPELAAARANRGVLRGSDKGAAGKIVARRVPGFEPMAQLLD